MAKKLSGLVDTVLCAFCKLERRVYVKKHIDWTNVVLSFLAAVLLMFAVWQSLEPKALLFFSINIIVAEVFVNLRWRLSLPCPHCGFDPLLYKTDREKAAMKVKQTLDEIKASGRHLLTPNNPFKNLPKLSPKDLEKHGVKRTKLELDRALDQGERASLVADPKHDSDSEL